MSRSSITFFCHRRRRFVASYLFRFLSYRFETRQYCSYTYKECVHSFSTGDNEHVIVFLFPCWSRYYPLSACLSGFPGVPPVRLKSPHCHSVDRMRSMCLPALANVGTPTIHIMDVLNRYYKQRCNSDKSKASRSFKLPSPLGDRHAQKFFPLCSLSLFVHTATFSYRVKIGSV